MKINNNNESHNLQIIDLYGEEYLKYLNIFVDDIVSNEIPDIFSFKYVAYSFLKNIRRDLAIIKELGVNPECLGNCNVILRTILEHIALLINIREGIVDVYDYLGLNNKIEIKNKITNPIKELKKIGQNRYKQKSISDLCKTVDKKFPNDRMKYYDVYKYLCDYSHDLYFQDILTVLGNNIDYDLDYKVFNTMLVLTLDPLSRVILEIIDEKTN